MGIFPMMLAYYCPHVWPLWQSLLSPLWFQILSVLLVAGSFPAWTSPQFTSSPTTPVPILRYVDNQNIDGSYTYGYEVNKYTINCRANLELFKIVFLMFELIIIQITKSRLLAR